MDKSEVIRRMIMGILAVGLLILSAICLILFIAEKQLLCGLYCITFLLQSFIIMREL